MPRSRLRDRWRPRHRLAALLMLVAFLHGLAYALLVPLWQAPDEPGHYEYARLLAEKGRPLRATDRSPALQQEIIASLAAHDFWHWLQHPTPHPLPVSFADDPLLARSGRQVGDEPLLYYLLPALICRLVPGIELQVRLIRLYSVLLTALAAGVAVLAACELFPNDRRLAGAIGAFPALLPMAAFVGSAVNNDSLALLSGALFFWVLICICRRGLNGKRTVALVLSVLLALVSKKTTLFLLPLTLVSLLHLAWRGILRFRRRIAVGLLVILIGMGGALWLGRGPAPADWMWGRAPVALGRTDRVAHQGRFAFQVGAEGPPWLVQVIPADTVSAWSGERIAFTVWVRSEARWQWGHLTLYEGEEVERYHFLVGPHWARQQLNHQLSPQPRELRVAVTAGVYGEEGSAGRLYFDDLRLVAHDGRNLLRNGGAEVGARWGEEVPKWLLQQALVEAKLIRPGRPPAAGVASVLSRLLDAHSYDLASWRRYGLYTLLTFAGFWANFGWLTLPLPVSIYALLALLCATAGVGLALQTVRGYRSKREVPGWQRSGFGLWALGLILALVQTFLPMIGRSWQPQGRYLFPAIVPIATSLCLGWRVWVRPRLRPALWTGYWAGLFALDAYCLLVRVGGYYWGMMSG